MNRKRRQIPIATKSLVLHEAGYRCANPTCRNPLTLDVHHIVYHSEDGSDTPENLIAICPYCHSLHHSGHIPLASLRAWKLLLLALNEGYDRKAIDLLLALHKLERVIASGDAVLNYSGLIASGLVSVTTQGSSRSRYGMAPDFRYEIKLSEKGLFMVEAWKKGDQNEVMKALS